MIQTPTVPNPRHFCHHAMQTTFSLRFPSLDEPAACGLARECFDRIDELESRLSRFLDGSDVSRINSLSAGETLRISEDCHRCLLIALEGYRMTSGQFDISIGREIQARKLGYPPPSPSIGNLVIHPDTAAVTCLTPGRELDLGGIGKGFALDVLADLLADWEVEDALLCAGASSILAIGSTSWPISLQGDHQVIPFPLQQRALSASGTGIQGEHIIAPPGVTTTSGPTPTRVWVTATTASQAEILSTALMLMPIRTLHEPLPNAAMPSVQVFIDTQDGISGPWTIPAEGHFKNI